MDLMESFNAIVYLKNVADSRHALVNLGDGIDKTIEYQLPGAFVVNPPQQSILSLPVEASDGPTGDELKIVDLHTNGSSLRAIALEVYGSTGGHQTSKIKNVLSKWVSE